MVIRYAADTIRSRNGPTAGYFYCNNEFSVYIKEEQFIELCWGNRREGRPLGRPRRRCVDNIRVDLQEVGCGYVD